MAKECFIIMPISTPEELASNYKGDEEHFSHVLEHLFIPAIEATDLKPIPPITKGSEVIQGEIIKNLESAELVLVDMSILNPNVFFEMGIRTALNKPTSLVKDSKTDKIPFDTSIINYHTYSANMDVWEIEKEIEKLATHIKECLKNKNENSLWKYFSLSTIAKPIKEQEGVEGKVGQLSMEIRALRKQIDEQSNKNSQGTFTAYLPIEKSLGSKPFKKVKISDIELIINASIKRILTNNKLIDKKFILEYDENIASLYFDSYIPNKVRNEILEVFTNYQVPVEINIEE